MATFGDLLVITAGGGAIALIVFLIASGKWKWLIAGTFKREDQPIKEPITNEMPIYPVNPILAPRIVKDKEGRTYEVNNVIWSEDALYLYYDDTPVLTLLGKEYLQPENWLAEFCGEPTTYVIKSADINYYQRSKEKALGFAIQKSAQDYKEMAKNPNEYYKEVAKNLKEIDKARRGVGFFPFGFSSLYDRPFTQSLEEYNE